MAAHTKEPWRVLEDGERRLLIVAPWSDCVQPVAESGYGDYRGLHVASCEHQGDNPCVSKDAAMARMRRIVACVNACAGMGTDVLENMLMLGDTIKSRFAARSLTEIELTKQRDELLAALENVSTGLRRAGANIPAPENKGTIESAMATGLSIALLLVEDAIASVKCGAA